MAASSLNVIRVRLHFDYPPPAVSDCRMCWLLVDLNKCRVVTDLVSIIREKFDYSRRTVLDLFIEDCYLPPAESIYVVRDNDSIRVKVDSLPCVNAVEASKHLDEPKGKKRGREEEEQSAVDGLSGSLNKRNKNGENAGSSQAGDDEKRKKDKRKKKRKKEKQVNNKPEATPKPAGPAKGPTPSKPPADKSGKKVPASTVSVNGKHSVRKRCETVSSDSSEEETLQRKVTPPRSPPKPSSGSAVKKPVLTARKGSSSSSDSSSCDRSSPARASVKSALPGKSTPISTKPVVVPANTNVAAEKRAEASSDSDSSSLSPSSVKPPPKKPPVATPAPSAVPAAAAAATTTGRHPQDKPESPESDGSSSSSEIELVIKRPAMHGTGLNMGGVPPRSGEPARSGREDHRSPGRGRGQGEGWFPRKGGGSRGGGRGQFGNAGGTPWNQGFRYDYENREQQPSDTLTNKSLVFQNPPEPTPKRDYSTMPLLAAPPAVGQKIAFKLLELTENYTPEVSDYKEGKIVGFNHSTNVIELELHARSQAPAEPGKFDLVYQNADGSESVEYAVTHGSQLSERWNSLLEPRLIVENMG